MLELKVIRGFRNVKCLSNRFLIVLDNLIGNKKNFWLFVFNKYMCYLWCVC